MYDVRQFKPALYLVVLLGFAGFGLASAAMGMWALSTLLVVINAWMMRYELFKPLPRWLANSITLLCFLYVAAEFTQRGVSPILAIGEFLVLLQVVKIWEQRANRDYAQLLVLSLLLMVAAAISTASLFFGLMLIAYLFLSLYSCLLFHLKVETDEARQAMALPEDQVYSSTLRQDQRHLSSSMRRLTGLISAFSVTCAILVFIFFPRGTGAGMLGQMQWRPKDTMTGFSEQVNFQQVARIARNDADVATVKVWKDDQLLDYAGPLFLRGVTHDYYSGLDDANHSAFSWGRSGAISSEPQDLDLQTSWTPEDAQLSDHAHYRQQVELSPTGTGVIFGMAGITTFAPQILGSSHRISLRYLLGDETLLSTEPITQPIKYEIFSTGTLTGRLPDVTRPPSRIDPLIEQYARRPDVVGELARRRDMLVALQSNVPGLARFKATPLDEDIARAIEAHLRKNFQYTLDLTDTRRIQGRDPMVAFLYDFKKGHCEYFAGAMTLLCQSLGMHARLVVGFKCDEYNNFGHYYNVRQSHAHAWVEVLTSHGWETFDPTSGHEAGPSEASAWQKTIHLFEFLQYSWANAIIAYDSDNRDNLIRNVDATLTNTAQNSTFALGPVRDFFDRLAGWLANKVVGPLIILLSVALVGSIAYFIYERWKLRRRASRIGLDLLAVSDQLRLVRQLAFYDELLRLLERKKIVRPSHLTPLEFSDTLTFLPGSVYDTIHRLTELFYRVRYGHAQLAPAQQRRLAGVVAKLAECFE